MSEQCDGLVVSLIRVSNPCQVHSHHVFFFSYFWFRKRAKTRLCYTEIFGGNDITLQRKQRRMSKFNCNGRKQQGEIGSVRGGHVCQVQVILIAIATLTCHKRSSSADNREDAASYIWIYELNIRLRIHDECTDWVKSGKARINQEQFSGSKHNLHF